MAAMHAYTISLSQSCLTNNEMCFRSSPFLLIMDSIQGITDLIVSCSRSSFSVLLSWLMGLIRFSRLMTTSFSIFLHLLLESSSEKLRINSGSFYPLELSWNNEENRPQLTMKPPVSQLSKYA